MGRAAAEAERFGAVGGAAAAGAGAAAPRPGVGRATAIGAPDDGARGGASLAPEPTLLAAPAGAGGAADGSGAGAGAPGRQARSKGDARLLQRLQEELTESRGECKRLAEQVNQLQTKLKSMQGAKRDILACCAEMSDYLATHRD